jgi:hypothetical protein
LPDKLSRPGLSDADSIRFKLRTTRGARLVGHYRNHRTVVLPVETLAVATEDDHSTQGVLAAVEAAIKKPLRLPHVRPVRAAFDGAHLPNELPEDAA